MRSLRVTWRLSRCRAGRSSLTVNIPTVGRVPQGATVEKMVETPFLENDISLLIAPSNFSTAAAVAKQMTNLW